MFKRQTQKTFPNKVRNVPPEIDKFVYYERWFLAALMSGFDS